MINTIGAKEGLSHLMWTLVQPGDVALVPEPSYPIHIYAPVLAGAEVRRVHLSTDADFFDRLTAGLPHFVAEAAGHRHVVPAQPDDGDGRQVILRALVDFAHRNDVMLVHDFAYADISFDGYTPPRSCRSTAQRRSAVELYTLSKSHSMAGWRVGFVVGNSEIVGALAQLKSYLDYGTFQPIQIASIIALNEYDEYIDVVVDEYEQRRDVLVEGLARAGWEGATLPTRTMFVWARIPERFQSMGSLKFALDLLDNAAVAVSPGIGLAHRAMNTSASRSSRTSSGSHQQHANIKKYFAELGE